METAREAWLSLDSPDGHVRQRVLVLGETPTQFHIQVFMTTQIPGGTAWLAPGDTAFVAHHCIMFDG
jgi:hypothetical protein